MGKNSEEELLNELYPEGSLERQVLDYSRDHNREGEEVPPMLRSAFRILMGVSLGMGTVSLLAYLYATT